MESLISKLGTAIEIMEKFPTRGAQSASGSPAVIKVQLKRDPLGCFIFDFFLKFWGDARIICSYDIMRLSTKFEQKKIKFDMRACRFSPKIGIFSHFFSNNFFSASYFFQDACT